MLSFGHEAEERLLLRFDEVAERLHLSRSTIYELVNRGELPTVRVGRAVRIPASVLHEWVESQVLENAKKEIGR